MTILIAMIFSILIVSPISSIGIGLAIGISGLGWFGGWCSECNYALVGSWRVNKPGVPITVLLGTVKLMMPT